MKPRQLMAALGGALTVALVPAAAAYGEEAAGKALFLKNCAACHQSTGRGIPGAFPALAGNRFAQGAATEVASVLLKGRGGMPDFSDGLSDAEIASVLSYVRSAWGNTAAPLSEAEVMAQRAALQLEPYAKGQVSNKH